MSNKIYPIEKEQQKKLKTLIFLGFSVVLSVVLFFSSLQLRFPLPLDSLLTIAVAYYSGKAYGFTVGLLTGLLILVLGQFPMSYLLLPIGLSIVGFSFGFIVEKFREGPVPSLLFYSGIILVVWSFYESVVIHLILNNTLGVLIDETTLMLSLAGFHPLIALFLSIFTKRGIEAGFAFGIGILLKRSGRTLRS